MILSVMKKILMGSFVWIAIRIIGVVFFGGLCLLVGQHFLAPSKPSLDSSREKLGGEVIEHLLPVLRESRGSVRKVAVIHFAGDPTDFFTNALRERLEGTGILEVEDTPFLERGRTMVGMKNSGEYNQQKALEYGRQHRLDGVIIGRIDQFESLNGENVVRGEVTFLDVATGECLAVFPFHEEPAAGISGWTKKDDAAAPSEAPGPGTAPATVQAAPEAPSIMPLYMRVLGYLLLMLLLPVVTFAFIRQMVSRQSNRRNAFCLGIFMLADIFFALLILGMPFTGWGRFFLWLTALVLAALYNLTMMSFALRLES